MGMGWTPLWPTTSQGTSRRRNHMRIVRVIGEDECTRVVCGEPKGNVGESCGAQEIKLSQLEEW